MRKVKVRATENGMQLREWVDWVLRVQVGMEKANVDEQRGAGGGGGKNSNEVPDDGGGVGTKAGSDDESGGVSKAKFRTVGRGGKAVAGMSKSDQIRAMRERNAK